MANPFIWSRLARPGQPIPFLFGEIRPGETPQQIQGLQEEPAAASKPAQRAITAADALRDIMDIVKGMLGAQVGVTSANAPCKQQIRCPLSRHLWLMFTIRIFNMTHSQQQ